MPFSFSVPYTKLIPIITITLTMRMYIFLLYVLVVVGYIFQKTTENFSF